MTEYEATQRQRYIERKIRRYKREVAGLDAAGIDCTDSRNQLAKWQKHQRDFIDQTGLKRDYSREQIEKDSKSVDMVSKMDYNYKRDKKQFERYKSILGNNSPDDLISFQKLKYSDDWRNFKAYTRSIKIGELTPLADFELYKQTSVEIDKILVDITTKNGIVITGKSDHFIARTIGSIEQRRSGVNVQTSLKALLNPMQIDSVKHNSNGLSQRFIGKGAAITVNPQTGKLIQVNPLKNK